MVTEVPLDSVCVPILSATWFHACVSLNSPGLLIQGTCTIEATEGTPEALTKNSI
jgi:hypothetical protein